MNPLACETQPEEPPWYGYLRLLRRGGLMRHLMLGLVALVVGAAAIMLIGALYLRDPAALRQRYVQQAVRAFEARNFRLGNLVIRQQGAACEGGQIFVLDDVPQRPRGQFCDKGRSLVAPRRPIRGAHLDREKLGLNP